MVQLTLVDQKTEGFQENLLKEEEPVKDDYLCKTAGPKRRSGSSRVNLKFLLDLQVLIEFFLLFVY